MSRQTATAIPTGTSKCPPSQRVPALTGTTASNNDLASLFECPVCFDYVLPPILQCQSGHLVCSNSDHEELCEFRPYSCPCPGASCKWQGSLDAVMPHLMHHHKSITTLQVLFWLSFMLVLEKQRNTWSPTVLCNCTTNRNTQAAENFAYDWSLMVTGAIDLGEHPVLF
ncbi:hypothetical protein GDO86_008145 [Hymenochirus boettgeri]|uniref:SIAH-type domain-containing protein n=1 Tax=Hymenochirus boettgeri TaxID=247094 RepID=A0A8T2J1X9_9PIPI|nr:hypothetical protein GDO86_008145 [Hymenochirus boettgeri]